MQNSNLKKQRFQIPIKYIITQSSTSVIKNYLITFLYFISAHESSNTMSKAIIAIDSCQFQKIGSSDEKLRLMNQ